MITDIPVIFSWIEEDYWSLKQMNVYDTMKWLIIAHRSRARKTSTRKMHSLKPRDTYTYMYYQTSSSFARVMAWGPFGTKLFYESVLSCYNLSSRKQTSLISELHFFHSTTRTTTTTTTKQKQKTNKTKIQKQNTKTKHNADSNEVCSVSYVLFCKLIWW